MITRLLAGLLAVLPLLAASASASPTVEDPEVWRRAQALLLPVAAEVDLNARYLPGGSWFDVEDAGLGIRMTGRPETNGIVRFSGRAGSGLAFEARPLSTTRPIYGYSILSGSLWARVTRFGGGLLIEGQAGGRPLALTLERTGMPDSYALVGLDGTRLTAWITPSFARLNGRFDAEKMTREGLSVLGAAIALMFSEEGSFPPRSPRLSRQ
ncbi:MAG: hypothetical protein Q8T11_06835 [Elusimicrobiota bacterium]|nr:hypothetical protein [Elusimicrobiota bacterium]